MKSKIWNSIVLAVLVLTVGSFFFVFKNHQADPRLGGVPFVFWTGFLVTAMIVGLTFLASRFFPHQESDKK